MSMAEPPAQDPNHWRTPEFRQKIVSKLEELLRTTGTSNIMGKSAGGWENHLFQKAKKKEEYIALVSKLVHHLQSLPDKSKELQQQPQQLSSSGGEVLPNVVNIPGTDPINAMQNLAKQPSGMLQQGMAGQPGMVGQPALGSMPPGGRFVAYPGPPHAGRPGLQGQPRGDVFLGQPQQMPAMGRPGPPGQSNYVVVPNMNQPSLQHYQPMRHPGMAAGTFVNAPVAVDGLAMGAIPGPQGSNSAAGTGTLLSPGGLPASQSPGPAVGVAPSPATGAPSPGSALNTPGGNPGSVGTMASAKLSASEEQAYLEKWKQLQKYVEPLKRMINRIDKDEDREVDLNKMKNLLNILSDSTKRLPMATLLKCEQVLEKLEFSNKQAGTGTSVPVSQLGSATEQHMCQPLLDAIAAHIKSPTLNHTLHRTFGPAVRALHGPPLRVESPPPSKRLCIEEHDDSPSQDDELPSLIQGEIARLHHRFVVSLDSSHHPGSKVIQLLCRLEDRKLPSVPPVIVTLPESYPESSPSCKTMSAQYDATPFLRKVRDNLTTEIQHLSGPYSLTALLNLWDVCIRKACAPAAITA